MKVKRLLENVLQETLEPIRNRRAGFEKDIPAVYEMLRQGSLKARETAADTLSKVKKAMKIDYFDDVDLIAEQARRYGSR